MSKMLIGNGVVTTDEVIKQGYDFVGLKMAGMLKVQEPTVEQDLTIKGADPYYPPGHVFPLAFTQDLPGNNSSDAVATFVPMSSNKTFTVAVKDGVEPYTYAWFRRASNTDNPVGTNAPSYTITGYGTGNNGDYFVRVTDAEGTVIESQRERTKPAIALSTNLPATATWTVGTAASLSVAVNSATGLAPYTYQWQKLSGSTWNNISGATAATYNVASPATGDAGQYRCIVKSSNTNPPNSTTSATCTVTVNQSA